MTDFGSVVPALQQTLIARGYASLTPVQEAMLAPAHQDVDLLVSAQTGSGKTVAFGLAMAATLLRGRDRFEPAEAPLALVVAPTRELALQVRRELDWLFSATGARIASCVGGMDISGERRALSRGAHMVVGTPGRLVDHIKRGSLDMSALGVIVLDEADEMLDLGFREDLEHILSAAPAERRSLMFSATVPASITALARRYQTNAVRVKAAAEEKQHLDIRYRALVAASQDHENAIINVLRYYEAQNAIVFCSTRATVNHRTSRFNNRGFAVVALSGELSQKERSHALQALRDGRAHVCVATDVAARGLDLPDLELVIHGDLPRNTEALLHRSGRTGRAGRKGDSVLIVPHSARRRTERLLRDAGIEAQWDSPPTAADIRRRDDERLLADPVFAEPPQDEDGDLAARLLAQHGAERIASAFVRLRRQGKSAPEELIEAAAPARPPREDEPRKPRDSFANGVWVSLSVGREQSAEPRWLLPMLCKAGGLTKRDIGAIQVGGTETYVEIAPERVDELMARIGAGGMLEQSIRLTRLQEKPEGALAEAPAPSARRERGGEGKPPRKPRKPAGAAGSTRPWKRREAEGKPRTPRPGPGRK